MILCICNAVTDREVDDVIRRGAGSVDAVTQMCGAGGDCGSCRKDIEGRLAGSASGARTLSRASDCSARQSAPGSSSR